MSSEGEVRAYEVLYASDEDSFRTVQVHTPMPGRFYLPIEVRQVMLRGVGQWRVDHSHPECAKAVNGLGGSKSLNAAIKQGHVTVHSVVGTYREPIQNAS